MEAETALVRADQAGIDAVLWGLSHPNVHVRRGCAGFLDHPEPQIREFLGFREATVEDGEALVAWLDDQVLPDDQHLDSVRSDHDEERKPRGAEPASL